ncbi:MAG: hypothetical protein ABIL09_14070, partial [Gemmatimonadota bacterium]
SDRGVPNKALVFTAYALAQTACLNEHRGAIGTGELGTIRQRWYFSKDPDAMGFKFAAQAFETYVIQSADVVFVGDHDEGARARELGACRVELKTDKDEVLAALAAQLGRTPRAHYWPRAGWGRAYACKQSEVLAELVRQGLTYDELWCRDASRDVESFTGLLPDFYGCILLEKQGLFEHCQTFSKNAGVPVLVAMSGANAFSSVEAILFDNFATWEGDYKPAADNPLHLFVISDHDYSGMVPIQGGAAAQFERYLPDAVEVHRVGITPEQVEAEGRTVESAGYEFQADRNRATEEWADEHGLWVDGVCYGLEVEALAPRAFVEALVAAVVEACGGDEELKRRLLEAAEPDWDAVEYRAQEEARKASKLLRTLAALEGWAREQFEEHAPLVDGVVTDAAGDPRFRELPEVKDAIAGAVGDQEHKVNREAFVDYVEGGWGYNGWRPVSAEQATDGVAQILLGRAAYEIADAADGLDETDVAYVLRDVVDLLADYGLEIE